MTVLLLHNMNHCQFHLKQDKTKANTANHEQNKHTQTGSHEG